MNYLMDTALFLWLIREEKEKISSKALKSLENADGLYLSSVSTLEIAIKYSIGKLKLKDDPERWVPELILNMGLRSLPVSVRHSLALAHLPFHHRDPFDRLLITQAKIENLTLISPDPVFKKYKVKTLW